MINLFEISGAITGIIGVYLTIRQNVWCWPMLMLSALFYAMVFFDNHTALYADALLQIVYFAMLIYGWVTWKKKPNQGLNFKPQRMNLKEILILSIISIILIGVLFLLLQKFTKDSLPLMDSITFVLSIVAQFLQAQKKIESWVVWFQVNSIYLLMYIDRELYFTLVFYFILWVMSIVGFLDWKKNLQTT